MFGLDPDTIRNIKETFSKFPNLEKALLYGSRAKGNYKKGSDIDITLMGKNLTLDNSVYPLMDELDKLYLPYTFDISIFNQIDNLDLVEHILRVGKTFYLKENGLLIDKGKLIIENEGNNCQLPKGWEVKRLGEVCAIINGGTPKTSIKDYWNGKINWITPKDMEKLQNRYIDETPRKITELGLRKSSAKLLPKNSIILSTRAPIGHLAINTTEMATNQGCRGIIPQHNIFTEYVYYFLSNSIDKLNELRTGVRFKELSTRALSSIQIPVPPLPEQKQIVQKLDALQAETKELEKIYQQKIADLEELKKSILQRAFSGQLIRENV